MRWAAVLHGLAIPPGVGCVVGVCEAVVGTYLQS
jgi:hypothetical protein